MTLTIKELFFIVFYIYRKTSRDTGMKPNNLTAEQYSIFKENGTEPPFNNAYWNNKEHGIYVDIVSGDVLFSSLDKFESGTGWPSFTKPVNNNAIITCSDPSHGMIRTEVRSKNSDGHLGHVFADGPAPAGLRYCINSASLRFIPVEKIIEEGYNDYIYLFENTPIGFEQIIIGGGCFWGVEAYFKKVKGILDTTVGYSGGTIKNPDYTMVCTGTTGHAETVLITFNPDIVNLERILKHFFSIHNPGTLNRQGPDIGTQYRSALYYINDSQKITIDTIIQQITSRGAIVTTEVAKAIHFFKAEEYHQDYLDKNPGGYCHINLNKIYQF